MNKIPENILIDESDRTLLESYGQWRMHSQGYACIGKYINKKYVNLLMHRVLMNPPKGYQVDHINGNKLDNRRCNLRIVTASENQWNRPNAKGYTIHKPSGKYMAYVFVYGRFKNLGYFETVEEAIEARKQGKEKYHKIPSR